MFVHDVMRVVSLASSSSLTGVCVVRTVLHVFVGLTRFEVQGLTRFATMT